VDRGGLVAVLTLVVGEILPKSLARANPDRVGKALLPAVAGAYFVLRPWVAAVSRTAARADAQRPA